jgi:hypothetical protein
MQIELLQPELSRTPASLAKMRVAFNALPCFLVLRNSYQSKPVEVMRNKSLIQEPVVGSEPTDMAKVFYALNMAYQQDQ